MLKEREKDPSKKVIFNDRYSDIILIFDFDPQDHLFSEDKIIEMMQYFTESSDMGKLYLNYPGKAYLSVRLYHFYQLPPLTGKPCLYPKA